MPDSTLSVSLPASPYACAKRRHERCAAREDKGRRMEILRGRGNADVEAVVIAGHDVERVLAFAALRVREAST